MRPSNAKESERDLDTERGEERQSCIRKHLGMPVE